MIVLLLIPLVLAAWFACGYTAAGLWLAYFQRKWPDLAAQDLHYDRCGAWLSVPFGPVPLVVACIMGGFQHGLIWTWPWCSDTNRKRR